ncbi:SDR family NAD(P)-dependent oxidoreductase [Spirosoma telluris]
MTNLQHERILLTGGTKGLGRAIADALVAQGANVTVIARNKASFNESAAASVSVVAGDVTDQGFIDNVIGDLKPTLLILNAGATPTMASLEELSWESFSTAWNTDVKAGLYGIQAALKTPLSPGSRVLIVSSGAALAGSPLSGSYAGAKRMLWLMAQYANGIAKKRSLGIQFQAILPMQIIAETNLGQLATEAYAQSRNMTVESFLAARGDHSLTPKTYAAHFIEFLVNENYADGLAYGINYDGISQL